jgi:hypothetical protein
VTMARKDYDALKRLLGTTRGVWVPGKIPGTVVSTGPKPSNITQEILDRYGGVPVASDVSKGDEAFLIHARRDIVRLLGEVQRLKGQLRLLGAEDPDEPEEFEDGFEQFCHDHLQRQYTPADDKDIQIIELKREIQRLKNLLGCFDDGLEEDVMAAIKGLERTVRLKFERAKEAANCGEQRPGT